VCFGGDDRKKWVTMRFLHTSDWHIGKKTENVERLQEQAEVLDEICDIANREGVEVVLVSGDVFDTFVPSSDAEELFYEKIVKIAQNRIVLIISGNHDDATRLCASAPLAGKHGVYFAGNVNVNRITDKNLSRPVVVSESGEGFCVVKNTKGEEVYIGMLPYPNEARFREKSTEQSHVERIGGWMDKCMASNEKNLPSILVSHLFTLGGIVSDGEREISLGGAKAVPKERFPKADYVALGHLHKRQVVDKSRNVIYCGSILQYAFDEVNVEKSVTVFDLNKEGVSELHTVALTKGRRLAKISACSVDDAITLLNNYLNYYVELTLKLKSPLNREESNNLHENFPNVISLKLEVQSQTDRQVRGRKELSDSKLFIECYKAKYGEEPDKELTELYLSLLAEVDENEAR